MKEKILRSVACIFLALVLLLAATACRQEPSFSLDDFDKHENTVSLNFSFTGSDSSEALNYDKTKLLGFIDTVKSQSVEYGYEELFNYDRAIAGILVDHTVEEHKYSALDANGKLTKEHLFDVVRQNNNAYLTGETSLIKDVSDELLLRICEIIVDAINDTLSQYPDIDKTRVYCNLGNLKVVEKKAALDFAAVEPGMVLHVNSTTSSMAGLFTGSNMYSVLVHEAMHIIQYGCACETIEGCVRRCGLAHSYSGTTTEQDYSDWVWLAEGSAERMASLYANVEPMTYTTHVNYIATLNLATMLQPDVPANYVETLYFYSDADRLFKLFDATTEDEKQEVYQMIYSLEMMQMEPADVKEAYLKHYGVEWSDEIRDDLNNKVKRPIVQTLTKCFFGNLAEAVYGNSMTKNDFLFLLNLYESTMNYHLRLNNPEYDQYNADFVEWYNAMRNELLACVENITLEDYAQFEASDGSPKICAGMKWLDQEKQNFLLSRFEANKCEYKFPDAIGE